MDRKMLPVRLYLDDLRETEREESEAKERGRSAYLSGKDYEDNPHSYGSLQWENWRVGYKRESNKKYH
jgi:hypothetical protein